MKKALRKDTTRILFAPHEIRGQMQLMVEELRRRGYFAIAATHNQEAVGHVNDENLSLSQIQSTAGKHHRADMSIVSANPSNLKERLRELVQDAQLWRRFGEQGMVYVKKHHDVRAIVDQCIDLYGID